MAKSKSISKRVKVQKGRRIDEIDPSATTKGQVGPMVKAESDASPSNLAGTSAEKNNQPPGKNTACLSGKGAVDSAATSETGVKPTTAQEGTHMKAVLNFRKTDKSGSSSYAIAGVKSSVYFNKGMFKGAAPATLEIELPDGFAFSAPGDAKPAGIAKMTPEERKAAQVAAKAKRDAMTPAEKAAAKLEKAKKALAAAEAEAAKVQA
jgi:hypothetical protein